MSELRALDPVPETVTLGSGTVVHLEPLRSRQFFKFLRIVTHGALPIAGRGGLFEGDPSVEEFVGRLVSLVVLSIPDAEDETIDFIHSMCKPAGLIEGRRLSKQDQERNAALWAALDEELDNPELDDLVSIIEAIVRREAEDIQALGKRLMAMFRLAQKTGQLDSRTSSPTHQSSPAASSSEDSPEASISSPASTAGPTRSSRTSRSAGSGRSSRPSANATTTETLQSVNG